MKKILHRVQQGMAKLDHETSHHTTSTPVPVPLTSIHSPPTRRDVYLHRKQRGVNLGSWFSLESWLTPSLFLKARQPKASELDVVSGMQPDEAKAMLEHHWDTFIDDGDFQWMVQHGINTIRIPVGYFHFLPGHPDQEIQKLINETDYEPHASVYAGAYSRISNAIQKAHSYGLGVLIDLHGAPAGQNKDGHCGVSSGKAAMWDSKKHCKKTVQILVAMAREYSKYENVVGLELINEPNNSGQLEAFYKEAINQIRTTGDQSTVSLPLYLGDAWDTNWYTGFVGQRASANNFLVNDLHVYRCFTPADQSIRCEDHAHKFHPGSLPIAHDPNGCGETSAWLRSMSHRCGHSLVIGEWSAAVNPKSLDHFRTDQEKRAAKARFAHNQWLTFEKFCAGHFFWTLKKEGGPDTGWCFYTAVEHVVLPSHLDSQREKRKSIQELQTMLDPALQQAQASHENFWDTQKRTSPSSFEHWRFAQGFTTAWNDSIEFLKLDESNEIGFDGQWQKTRVEAHQRETGQGSKMVWEFEHGFSQGLVAFQATLYK